MVKTSEVLTGKLKQNNKRKTSDWALSGSFGKELFDCFDVETTQYTYKDMVDT